MKKHDRELTLNKMNKPTKEQKLENLKIPNAETIEAMNDAMNGGGTRYANSEELFKALKI